MEHWRRYRQPKVYRSGFALKSRARRQWHMPTWRPSARFFKLTGLLIILVGLGWAVFGSSFFVVKDVTLAGEITPAVHDDLQHLVGQRILIMHEDRLTKHLTSLDPALEKIQVVRGFPDHLGITVVRRHPALLWQSGQTTWAIDSTGVAFPVDPSTTSGVPRVVDQMNQPVEAGKQLLSPKFILFAQAMFQRLPDHLQGTIDHAEVGETTFHLRAITQWGWAVLFDSTRPIDGQLASLDLILKERRADIHEYVDLRLDGWGYIK